MAEDAERGLLLPGESQELLIPRKQATTMLVPQALLDEYAGMDDLIGKALRGEIQLKPSQPEPYHRCFWCWLAAKLGRHDRCSHGYTGRDCPCNE